MFTRIPNLSLNFFPKNFEITNPQVVNMVLLKLDISKALTNYLKTISFVSQEAFMEYYFTAQRDNIFRNVEVLIYVFDVESREIDKDIHYYQSWYKTFL